MRRPQGLIYSFYRRRYTAGLPGKLALALLFAGLTGLGAQLRLPLPFTPVPVTGQVFFVLLSGVALGRWGGMSQLLYALLGALGIPWFANFSSGIGVLLGVTGGYILGFIAAAYLVGWFTDRLIAARTLPYQLLLNFLGVGLIYLFGALQLSILLSLNWERTLVLGVLPFIPGDILKALLVVVLGSTLTPRLSYDGELDAKAPLRKGHWTIRWGLLGSSALMIAFLVLFWASLVLQREATLFQLAFDAGTYGLGVLVMGLLFIYYVKRSF